MKLNIHLTFNFFAFHRSFSLSSFFFLFIIFNRKYRNRFLLSKIIRKKSVSIMYSCFRCKNFNFSKKCIVMLDDNVYNKCIRINQSCDLFASKNVNKY